MNPVQLLQLPHFLKHIGDMFLYMYFKVINMSERSFKFLNACSKSGSYIGMNYHTKYGSGTAGMAMAISVFGEEKVVSLEFQSTRAYSPPVFVAAPDVQSMMRPSRDFLESSSA